MATIKQGMDFTGYIIIRHKGCGGSKRVFVGKGFHKGYGPDGKADTDRDVYEDCYIKVNRFGQTLLLTPCVCGLPLLVEGGNSIYGRYESKAVCNGKCMGAIGHTCECQCGGANHGADHS